MTAIQFECPHCHQIIDGDDRSYGQEVGCPKCQTIILVPRRSGGSEVEAGRLIEPPGSVRPNRLDPVVSEVEVFNLKPAVRSYLGQLTLGMVAIVLGVAVAMRAREFAWPMWVALIPFASGLLVFLLVWIQRGSNGYRPTSQRLFVRRGWLARSLSELELYRVEDVQVDQGFLQRLLGYGRITVLAADKTTPRLELIGISRPIEMKEQIRTQYRAARMREGVRPTEFMRAPNAAPAVDANEAVRPG